jgi:hypothetical protein
MKVIICPGVLNVTVGSLGTHFISRFDADNLSIGTLPEQF